MDDSKDRLSFLCKEGFGVTQCPLEKGELEGPCKHEKQCESVKEASASENRNSGKGR